MFFFPSLSSCWLKLLPRDKPNQCIIIDIIVVDNNIVPVHLLFEFSEGKHKKRLGITQVPHKSEKRNQIWFIDFFILTREQNSQLFWSWFFTSCMFVNIECLDFEHKYVTAKNSCSFWVASLFIRPLQHVSMHDEMHSILMCSIYWQL